MGSDKGDIPIHKVTITRGFYMGVYPVTQAQWQAVMGDNPSHFQGDDNCPVENVVWEDCQKFCQKLRQRDGRPYRLPAEAEWEYACRAGTKTEYYSGDGEEALKKAGWYAANSGSKTHPVGKLKENAWGLYDMHGNVWQWCYEAYAPSPNGSIKDSVNDKRDGTVLRGGSWRDDPVSCRSAHPFRIAPSYRGDNCGCRVVFCLD